MDQSATVVPLSKNVSLPMNVLFGTSSWNYPGWQGTVYHRAYKSEADLRSRSLEEYVQYPWFRTVGIDSSFYGPPSPKTLERYAAQVPADFRWVSKVWEDLTIAKYPKHKRYGKNAGLENPKFLDAKLFREQVLRSFNLPGIREHTGPFVFQFPQMPLASIAARDEFLKRFADFAANIPDEFQYAVEVRNVELLVPQYFEVLNRFGLTHCFNHWTDMPPLREQMKAAAAAGGIKSDFYVARLLTPRGVAYGDAVKRFQPYREIQAPIPSMREDVVRLVRRAVERQVKVYVLVNNRLEGHAPGTIREIGQMVESDLASRSENESSSDDKE